MDKNNIKLKKRFSIKEKDFNKQWEANQKIVRKMRFSCVCEKIDNDGFVPTPKVINRK